MGQRELNLGLSKLHPIRPLQILGIHHGRTNDLNGTGTSTMPPRHFIVQLRNSPGQLQIAVFAIHVMSSGPAIVPEPNT
eukprot:scaffold242241_cov17-Cyclotella_meneghiniana.AAC.1